MNIKMLTLLPIAAAALSACAVPAAISPVKQTSKPTSHAAVKPVAKVVPEVVVTSVAPIVVKPKPIVFRASPFVSGSITKLVPVGGDKLAVTVSTPQAWRTWYSDTSVPVEVNTQYDYTVAPESRKAQGDIKVASFTAVLVCGDTSLTLKSDTGGFDLTPPFNYGTALYVRCPNKVTTASLQLTYDLSIETYADSGIAFHETGLLAIPIVFQDRPVVAKVTATPTTKESK